MNRRNFFGKIVKMVAALAVAPKVLAESQTKPPLDFSEPLPPLTKADCSPEMIEAFELMRDNLPRIRSIFEKVAKEHPYNPVPDEGIFTWGYGDLKISGRVGQYDECDYENGRARWFSRVPPSNTIWYGCMWRQAVRNKYTGELKYFISLTSQAKSVVPGQEVTVSNPITLDMNSEEIEKIARESFLRLQELAVEYHNREA
jgi:hypothetical protein